MNFDKLLIFSDFVSRKNLKQNSDDAAQKYSKSWRTAKLFQFN